METAFGPFRRDRAPMLARASRASALLNCPALTQPWPLLIKLRLCAAALLQR